MSVVSYMLLSPSERKLLRRLTPMIIRDLKFLVVVGIPSSGADIFEFLVGGQGICDLVTCWLVTRSLLILETIRGKGDLSEGQSEQSQTKHLE